MKLISPDEVFIYYIRDRADGRSHGIRIGRSTGACGFLSETPTQQQTHPVGFTDYDRSSAPVPLAHNTMPPILSDVVGEIEEEHPEIRDLLSGAISFQQALRS